MNDCILAEKTISCNGAPFKSKIMAVLVVAVIFINGFVPRSVIEIRTYDSICKIAVNQSVVILKLFRLPSMSLEIAMSLLHKTYPAKQKQNESNQNRANTSADYSMINADKNTGTRYGVDNQNDPVFLKDSIGYLYAREDIAWKQIGASVVVYVYLLLMLWMYALARSGMEDIIAGEIEGQLNWEKETNLKEQVGFFFIRKKNNKFNFCIGGLK